MLGLILYISSTTVRNMVNQTNGYKRSMETDKCCNHPDRIQPKIAEVPKFGNHFGWNRLVQEAQTSEVTYSDSVIYT